MQLAQTPLLLLLVPGLLLLVLLVLMRVLLLLELMLRRPNKRHMRERAAFIVSCGWFRFFQFILSSFHVCPGDEFVWRDVTRFEFRMRMRTTPQCSMTLSVWIGLDFKTQKRVKMMGFAWGNEVVVVRW